MGNGIHPAPNEFSEQQIADDPILRYFHYAHLPAGLREISEAFCTLAGFIIQALPRNSERTVALRKLLEAKDAGVRANVGAPATPLKNDVFPFSRVPPSGETFFDRLKNERRELSERLDKLEEYLGTFAFTNLPASQRSLLDTQAGLMRRYRNVLDQRIADIEESTGQTTARQSDKPDEEIDENVKLVGGDQSETPIPFE